MKIYISGAITGLSKQEYESRFEIAEQQYLQLGYNVANPVKVCAHLPQQTTTWEQYMLCNIEEIFTCDAMYMLNNWKQSRGARIEHAIAIERSMKIFYQ